MWFLSLLNPVKAIVDNFFGYLNKKQDVDLEKYKVDGKFDEKLVELELGRLHAIINTKDDTLGGRFMRYIFVYPLGIWWASAIADSILQKYYNWKWDVLTFPILEQWGGYIIMYLFVVTTLKPRR